MHLITFIDTHTHTHTHTHKHTHTLGRTPLDEGSAPRRDIYLRTHNTHMRQTSLPSPGFEPAIRANERSQTKASGRMATVNSVFTKLYSSSVSCVRTEGSKVTCCPFHSHTIVITELKKKVSDIPFFLSKCVAIRFCLRTQLLSSFNKGSPDRLVTFSQQI